MREIIVVAAIGAIGLAAAACGDDDGGGAFCDGARSFPRAVPVGSLDWGDEEALEDALGALRELADGAPEEVRGDLARVVERLQAAIQAGLRAPGPELASASANVDRYLEAACDIAPAR